MSSLSQARVVRVETLEKHPDADTLELTNVDGFPLVVKKGNWKVGDLGVYVPVDLITSDEPEFDFWPNKRVKGAKLRGILSCGLLVKPRPHHKLDDDVTEELRITKYEPKIPGEPISLGKTYNVKSPSGQVTYTDIDSLRKYHYLLKEGEEVVIHEKIHGANFRATYQNMISDTDGFHVGTRTRWVDGDNIWTKVSTQENLEPQLAKYPNHIFFGEVYGQVQDLKYGYDKGQLALRFFDVFSIHRGQYLNWKEAEGIIHDLNLLIAPELYRGPWLGLEAHKHLADGESALGPNIKEGFVVKPLEERWERKIGRMVLKYHSDAFLSRK